MNRLIKSMNSETGRIVVSVIWGLGLAALFRRVCVGRNCIVIKGPNPKKIQNKIYKYNNSCYKYTPYATKCGKKYIRT